MNFKDGQSGFTLIEILVATGLLAALSVGMLKFFDNSNTAQNFLRADHDHLALSREIQSVLASVNHCRASLGDPGFAVTFRGDQIQSTPSTGIEVWRADQDGIRSRKLYHPGVVSGKLVLTELEFTMPDYTAGVNFPTGVAQRYDGVLTIKGHKKLSAKNRSDFKPIQIPLNVSFNTDSSGTSVVTDCQAFLSGQELADDGEEDIIIWY